MKSPRTGSRQDFICNCAPATDQLILTSKTSPGTVSSLGDHGSRNLRHETIGDEDMSPENRYIDKKLADMAKHELEARTPGVRRESSADTSAAHKEARQALASGVLALDPGDPRSCSELTTSERKEAREEVLGECIRCRAEIVGELLHNEDGPALWVCGACTGLGEQTDGIVQKEVSDEWQTVSTHGGEIAPRKEAECALLGCVRPARIGYCYREPYTTARKFFCSAGHLEGYATTATHAEQTDGTVQEEVADEWQTVSTHGGESQAAQLVRERYATWAKRAHKWHAYLERERAWSTHGRLLSVLTGAASTLAAATVAPHFAAGVVGALMIATALIAWRGQVAQSRLESSRAADAWVSADRLAEVYKGLVVELDAVITTCDDFMKREQAEQVLAKSQQIEGAARFGVPEGLRSVLVEVCK